MTRIPIGNGARPSYIVARFANRHGLITGATGTGKTFTLATLAEGFSNAGVPCMVADVKGDLSGLLRGACPSRALQPGATFRLTVESLGPDLLTRALALSEAQAGAVEIAFAAATADGRPLDSLADLRGILQHMNMNTNARALSRRFGLVSPASVAAIQRSLLSIEREGMAPTLARPCFDVAQLLEAPGGAGLITVLDATRLMRSPALYGAAMLFILADLYERLPEVGDLERPRLVLFLDEAHLLFSEAPAALVQRVERIVRLIRSKGVGVYFASQAPADIPSPILAQLGNRIQHGMRAATVQEQRAARAAAETMPINPRIDAATAIMTLGIGQALVSTIGENGIPQPCDLVKVTAPRSPMGAAPELAPEPAPTAERVAAPSPFKAAIALVICLALALGAAVAAWHAFPRATVALGLVTLLALFPLKAFLHGHARH